MGRVILHARRYSCATPPREITLDAKPPSWNCCTHTWRRTVHNLCRCDHFLLLAFFLFWCLLSCSPTSETVRVDSISFHWYFRRVFYNLWLASILYVGNFRLGFNTIIMIGCLDDLYQAKFIEQPLKSFNLTTHYIQIKLNLHDRSVMIDVMFVYIQWMPITWWCIQFLFICCEHQEDFVWSAYRLFWLVAFHGSD